VRQAPRDGAEQPSTKPPGQKQAGGAHQSGAANPWYRRVSFWRSVAGMAVAIALGCTAIALETASELSWLNASFHRRLGLLGSRIARLRSETANSERQLAEVRAEQLAGLLDGGAEELARRHASRDQGGDAPLMRGRVAAVVGGGETAEPPDLYRVGEYDLAARTLTEQEKLGRDTWNFWTAGNEKLWRKIAGLTQGNVDLLMYVDSRRHDRRCLAACLRRRAAAC